MLDEALASYEEKRALSQDIELHNPKDKRIQLSLALRKTLSEEEQFGRLLSLIECNQDAMEHYMKDFVREKMVGSVTDGEEKTRGLVADVLTCWLKVYMSTKLSTEEVPINDSEPEYPEATAFLNTGEEQGGECKWSLADLHIVCRLEKKKWLKYAFSLCPFYRFDIPLEIQLLNVEAVESVSQFKTQLYKTIFGSLWSFILILLESAHKQETERLEILENWLRAFQTISGQLPWKDIVNLTLSETERKQAYIMQVIFLYLRDFECDIQQSVGFIERLLITLGSPDQHLTLEKIFGALEEDLEKKCPAELDEKVTQQVKLFTEDILMRAFYLQFDDATERIMQSCDQEVKESRDPFIHDAYFVITAINGTNVLLHPGILTFAMKKYLMETIFARFLSKTTASTHRSAANSNRRGGKVSTIRDRKEQANLRRMQAITKLLGLVLLERHKELLTAFTSSAQSISQYSKIATNRQSPLWRYMRYVPSHYTFANSRQNASPITKQPLADVLFEVFREQFLSALSASATTSNATSTATPNIPLALVLEELVNKIQETEHYVTECERQNSLEVFGTYTQPIKYQYSQTDMLTYGDIDYRPISC